jgi:hypothetical protein
LKIFNPYIMTKVKYSALVSEMRNKLNGSVMSKNRYGNYIRNKVTPVNPQTSYQLAQRSALASLSAGWRSLTQEQRDNWSNSAKDRPRTDIFGDAKILTGQALYVSANLNLQAAGTALIDTPGQLTDVPLMVISSINFEFETGVFAVAAFGISPTTVPAGFKLIVYCTPGVSAGVSFVKNRFRYLGVFSPVTGVVDIFDEYVARFGSPNLGEKVFVRIALVSNNSGQLGLPYEAVAIVS